MSVHTARCAISRQSIAEGEACRVMLISQAATFNSCAVSIHDKQYQLYGTGNTDVGPESSWKRFSPFLRAVYDDFGMSSLILESKIERVKALNVFSSLFHTGAQTAAGNNSSHDLAVDFQEFIKTRAPTVHRLIPERNLFGIVTVHSEEGVSVAELQACWTYACDLIRRNRVFVYCHLDQPRPLEACFVHEEAYQAMYRHACGQVDWDQNSMEPAAYAKRSIEERLARAKGYYDEEIAQGKTPEDARSYATAAFSDSGVSDYRGTADFTDSILRQAYCRLAVQVYDGKLSVDAYVTVLTPLLADLAVGRAMQAFDLKLEPVTYVRGDVNNSTSLAYAKLVLQVGEAVSAARKEKLY